METQAEIRRFAAARAVSGARKGQNISVRIDDPVGEQGLMNSIQTGLKSLSVRKVTQPASAGLDESFKEKFETHFAHQGVEAHFIQELLALFTRKIRFGNGMGEPELSFGAAGSVFRNGNIRGNPGKPQQQPADCMDLSVLQEAEKPRPWPG